MVPFALIYSTIRVRDFLVLIILHLVLLFPASRIKASHRRIQLVSHFHLHLTTLGWHGAYDVMIS